MLPIYAVGSGHRHIIKTPGVAWPLDKFGWGGGVPYIPTRLDTDSGARRPLSAGQRGISEDGVR